jgi:hypothetical protein
VAYGWRRLHRKKIITGPRGLAGTVFVLNGATSGASAPCARCLKTMPLVGVSASPLSTHSTKCQYRFLYAHICYFTNQTLFEFRQPCLLFTVSCKRSHFDLCMLIEATDLGVQISFHFNQARLTRLARLLCPLLSTGALSGGVLVWLFLRCLSCTKLKDQEFWYAFHQDLGNPFGSPTSGTPGVWQSFESA